MTRLQSIEGIEPTWLAVCDHVHCTAQQSLIADRDASAVAAAVHGMNAQQVALAIAFGRRWLVVQIHGVGERMLCPVCSLRTDVEVRRG